MREVEVCTDIKHTGKGKGKQTEWRTYLAVDKGLTHCIIHSTIFFNIFGSPLSTSELGMKQTLVLRAFLPRATTSVAAGHRGLAMNSLAPTHLPLFSGFHLQVNSESKTVT